VTLIGAKNVDGFRAAAPRRTKLAGRPLRKRILRAVSVEILQAALPVLDPVLFALASYMYSLQPPPSPYRNDPLAVNG
jgi:hypothetical protein